VQFFWISTASRRKHIGSLGIQQFGDLTNVEIIAFELFVEADADSTIKQSFGKTPAHTHLVLQPSLAVKDSCGQCS
jgi:hypothetical protein